MSKSKSRLTIVIDSDVNKYVRNMQSELLSRSETSVSFSNTMNSLLKYVMKKNPNINDIKKISDKLKS